MGQNFHFKKPVGEAICSLNIALRCGYPYMGCLSFSKMQTIKM